jgi:hypothetical protein
MPATGGVGEILKEVSLGFFANRTRDKVDHKFTDCAKMDGDLCHSNKSMSADRPNCRLNLDVCCMP